MNRRTAITAAGSVALVVAAASAAIGANVGILRTASDSGGVGKLNPAVQSVPQTTPADPQVETVYVDDVVHVPGSTTTTVGAPATTPVTGPAGSTTAGSSPAVGNPDDAPNVDDDGVEHSDDDDHEDEDEHEGAEDDD